MFATFTLIKFSSFSNDLEKIIGEQVSTIDVNTSVINIINFELQTLNIGRVLFLW
jgi:hypothetical protein